jgi:hypothetical protein
MREQHPLVINIRSKQPCVYVGRRHCSRHGNFTQSDFHNPYHLGHDNVKNRKTVLMLFTRYLFETPGLVEKARRELRGQTLGCWCAPELCHAEVLAWVANESLTEEQCIERIEDIPEE